VNFDNELAHYAEEFYVQLNTLQDEGALKPQSAAGEIGGPSPMSTVGETIEAPGLNGGEKPGSRSATGDSGGQYTTSSHGETDTARSARWTGKPGSRNPEEAKKAPKVGPKNQAGKAQQRPA